MKFPVRRAFGLRCFGEENTGMKRKGVWFLMVLMASLAILNGSTLQAQPDKIVLDHSKDFENKGRPSVPFPHNRHIEFGLSCKDCHHVYDKGKNVLDESNLEEGNQGIRCSACHRASSRPDLEEAFHQQCVGCHRQLLKEKKKTGPRFCGECHRRK